MFSQNMYSGPGRKKKLTGGLIFFIIILLILQGGIIVGALNLAVKTKVRVVWLDPFLQISIQGADGYAVAEPVFDRESFRSSFESILLKADSSLKHEEASALSEEAADSMIYEFHIRAADGETDVSIIDDEEDNRLKFKKAPFNQSVYLVYTKEPTIDKDGKEVECEILFT